MNFMEHYIFLKRVHMDQILLIKEITSGIELDRARKITAKNYLDEYF